MGEALRDTDHPAKPEAPDPSRSPSRADPEHSRRRLFWLLIAGIIAAGALAALGPEALRQAGLGAWAQLKAAPAPLYFAILTLALLAPVPVSVLYVTAGPLFGVATSLAWIAPVLLVNSLLVYGIGATALRPALRARLARYGRDLPQLTTRSDQLLFIVLIRVTPGIPYFVQSWTLVLAGVALGPFLLISVGIQMVYATGFVVLGRSAFEGQLGVTVLAVVFLVAAGLCAAAIRARLRRTDIERPEAAPPGPSSSDD